MVTIKQGIFVLLMVICSNLLCLYAYHRVNQPSKLVVVDMDKLITEKAQDWLTTQGGESSDAMIEIAQDIETQINRLAIDKKLVVLPMHSVFAGAPDYTEIVKNVLKK